MEDSDLDIEKFAFQDEEVTMENGELVFKNGEVVVANEEERFSGSPIPTSKLLYSV